MDETNYFLIPSVTTTIAFSLIVVAVLSAWFMGIYYAAKRGGRDPVLFTLLSMFVSVMWVGLLSIFTMSETMWTRPMPILPVFMGSILVVCVGVGLSPLGKLLATSLPLWALVAFQSFRLPLELVLHSWVEQGSIPQTMTWTGSNFDIISGIAAIIGAPLATRFRWAAWAANLIGFALLLNVMRVVVMSSPLPFAWGVQPPLALVTTIPFMWIAPVCVGGALIGHIVLTRALLVGSQR